jgi:hypothetical protein
MAVAIQQNLSLTKKTIIMKYFKLFTILIFLFVNAASKAQQEQNFYTIKTYWDNYYDSLLLVNGPDSMQGSGYNPYKRWVDYWEPKVYPHGDFSIERQEHEQYVADYLNGETTQNSAGFTLDWDFIGPDKMPEGASTAFKGLGQIHYIAFDPNDPTCDKMFACSPAGGLWRSLDGGNIWFNAGTDKGLPLCGVSSIAIDPENSDTHWFVSTGNGDPMPDKSWAQNSIGLGRTIDGGINWEIIGLENIHQMRKVILKRHQGNIQLLVATTGGLYECEDALAGNPQFSLLEAGNFYDVEFDPQNTGIAYASSTGPNSSVYKINWINNSSAVLPSLSSIPVEDGRRLIIEISDAAPQYLFIVSTYMAGSNTSYLYRYNLTTNEITPKGSLDQSALNEPGVGPERAMGWTVSPVLNNNNELIMVHGNTAPIRITSNLLDSYPCIWTNVTSGYSSCEIHVDMHYIVFEPDGQTLWVGNDGGVYKSTMPDLQANWQEKNNGLAVATIHHLAVTEDDKEIALSGAYDCGINLYTNSNDLWSEKHVVYGWDGFQCQIDWDNANRMWAGTNGFGSGQIHRSVNGGLNFSSMAHGFHWHSYFIQNNSMPEILYGTGESGLRRSTDYGDTWQMHSAYPGVSDNSTWRVTNSITHDNYIYASWKGNTGGDHQKVFKSVTGGGTSTSDWEDVGSPIADKWIHSIAVDFYNPDHIWVAAEHYVYDVNTLTKEWTDITNGLPAWLDVNHLEILKGAEGVLFAATSKGLYYYNEDNIIWQKVESDLPNVDIQDIQIDIANNRIVVGTFGRGVWQAPLPCIESSETTCISNDETWTHDRYVIGNLSVETGNTLTLNNSVVRLNKNNKVIVKPGAKLIINGGKFSNACDDFWRGIEVWGDADAHQYTIDGDCAQGQLILKNGAVIENAAFGVLLGKPDTNSDGYNDDYAGGIITVAGNNSTEDYSASFINCFIGVAFRPYQNHLPVPQSSWPTGNLSNFTNTHFEVNEESNIVWWNTPMVDLMGVNGIHFNGCSFLNNQILNQNNLGYGIYASGSGFVVNDYCTILNPTSTGCEPEDIVHSSFTNFWVGVTVSGSGSNTVGIYDADFNDNAYGIQLYNINNASIISNNFNIGEASGEEQEQCGQRASGYGIWMDNCSGFAIEENYFTKATGAPTGNYTGIRVAETNAVDEIYRNEFVGLSYGIYAEGKNWRETYFSEGLSLLCNEFNGSYRDIDIEKNPDQEGGIQSSQGSANNPAGNEFINHTGDYKIYNNGNYPILYYYDAGSGTANPNPSYQISRLPARNSNNCPSHYGGGSSGRSIVLTVDEKLATEQEYLAASNNYNNVKTLYDNLQDGGDTEGLQTEVETAWPDDTWELRAELLGKSPHLSTEVLKAAADKTEVLPESILFEILAANPDELRKEELISYLEDKENPLPGYMIDILHQVAYGTTYKTALQNQMAESTRLKTRAANDMLRSILNEEERDYNALRNWLDNLGGLKADQQIIESYFTEGNVDDALALADIIPELYQLSEYDLDEHNYYLEMLNLRIDLLQQGRSYNELTAGEITQLENLAQNSHGTAGAQARAILEQSLGQHFCDCLNIMGNQSFKSTTINPALLNQALGVNCTVEPNPAREWAAFDYTLPEAEGKGVINITDASGRVIKTIEVTGTQGQYVWDTREVKPGVYFYTFVVNGTGTTSKLVITK